MRRFSLLSVTILAFVFRGYAVCGANPPSDSVQDIVSHLQDRDADSRQRAAVLANNLPGQAFEALQAQLQRRDLSPSARADLERAMKFVRARHAKLERAREDGRWEQQFALESFEKFVRHDAKWDAAAREALRLALMPPDEHASPPNARTVFAACKKAVDAGCPDPLIHYYCGISGQRRGSGLFDFSGQFQAASDAALSGQYPAYFKCRILLSGISVNAPSHQEDALTLLPEALKTPGLPPGRAEALLVAVQAPRFMDYMKDPESALRDLIGPYAIAFPNSAGPLVWKGKAYIDWAWQARGGGFADTVTPEGWKLFAQRLAVAREALEEAYKRDPSDTRAPTLMIKVCMGQGSDLEQTTTWFTRAMAADPDNYDACDKMLFYLYPRWYGTPQQMIAFGRECLKTYNWRAQLPFILLKVHQELAAESGDEKAYYLQPAVWDDLRDIYQSLLWVDPENTANRNTLAFLACKCGQWQEANHQLQMLGDKVDAAAFGGKAMLDYFRRKAARHAGAASRPAP